MHRKITHALRRVSQNIPTIKRARRQKRLILDFADRSNLVYFGFVSQLSDEHKIVRGLTVSTKHHDNHYCIGTYHGYDTVFVERTDTLLTSGHKHTWHILEFDLKTSYDLPHIFIGSTNHGNGFHSLLATKYSNMIDTSNGSTTYTDVFTSYFSVYATPTQSALVDKLIDQAIAEIIGKHFKGLVIEITDSALYVYSEKANLSSTLLDTMIANGVWLANHIDEKSQRL